MRSTGRTPLVALLLLPLVACGGAAAPSHATGAGADGGLPHDDAGPGTPFVPADAGPLPIATSTATRTPAASIPAASLAAAATANNAFALDLYARLDSVTPAANLLTSPISASLALTMTYAGAAGETATQMASALHLGSDASSVFDGQNALSQALASRAATALGAYGGTSDDYALEVVNSVWGDLSFTWSAPFLNTLAISYGTGVYEQDFIHQPEAARATINTWVSDETDGKITGLLPDGSIDTSSRLVLVNAIHLKFPWASAFSVNATGPSTFTRGDQTTVSSPFMNQTTTFPYVDDGNAQIVALPLTGNQLAVVIALPHGDLATYEAGLTATSAGIAQPTTSALVQLSLPSVTFTSATFSLASALKAMGMTDAFTGNVADFQSMCATASQCDALYIKDVLQKATIAMQENGVEAAAATAVLLSDAGVVSFGPPATPVPMVVDKPFLLSIVDVPTGAVLFLGHITDPTNAGD